MTQKNFVFVMEQTLGNAVHASNLKQAFRDEQSVKIDWLDINYPPENLLEKYPPLSNWTIRSGLKARSAISRLSQKPDLYFFHTATLTTFSIGKTQGTPVIISLDATPKNMDVVGEAYNHKEGSKLAETLKLKLHRRTYNAAKKLVTWSRWAKTSLVVDYGIPADRIEVIPPGTDLNLWKLNPEDTGDRYNTGEDKKVKILFVGGDFTRKGGELLLQAYRELVKNGYPLELHLVTKAELSSEPAIGLYLHRGITANSPQMQRLYRQADIFALPTQGDCLPVAIGEALAAALPVISTRVGAIDEAVLEGENGLLIQPGDAEALAKALKTLVENSELRLKMGERSRALAEIEHDAFKNSIKLLNLCKVNAGLKEAAISRL
jgi:glycosyltransferase involved in cell wall biosynthesis